MKHELPFQTYQRITQQQWPGGRSPNIVALLNIFGIGYKPGSAEANLQLQYALVHATQQAY
jgi:hypothetical protein